MNNIFWIIYFMLIMFSLTKAEIDYTTLDSNVDNRRGVLLFNRTKREAEVTTCGNSIGPKCQDCQNLMTCMGRDPPVNVQSCAAISPNKPYCVNNGCQHHPDNSKVCKAGFQCTTEGYMPDPRNCHLYHICDGINGYAETYLCIPPNYIYSSEEKGCIPVTDETVCKTINCDNSIATNGFVAAEPDAAFYAYCDNQLKNILMFKCDDEIYEEFNPMTLQCEYRCRGEGKFPNLKNCTQFYECFIQNNQYMYILNTCPEQFSFNSTSLLCQKSSEPCKSVIGDGGDEAGDGEGGDEEGGEEEPETRLAKIDHKEHNKNNNYNNNNNNNNHNINPYWRLRKRNQRKLQNIHPYIIEP